MTDHDIDPTAAARVHYTDPRVRRLAAARWRLTTGGTHQDWLFLGKDNPDALITEGRDWTRAAVAAGIIPPTPPVEHHAPTTVAPLDQRPRLSPDTIRARLAEALNDHEIANTPGPANYRTPAACGRLRRIHAASLAEALEQVLGELDDTRAALDRGRQAATCARMFTSHDQPAQVTVRAVADKVLRAIDGTDLPNAHNVGGTWPPPVIGTARHTRPPMDGRALVEDFRTHVLGETRPTMTGDAGALPD